MPGVRSPGRQLRLVCMNQEHLLQDRKTFSFSRGSMGLILFFKVYQDHTLLLVDKTRRLNFCSLTVHSYIIYRDINQKAIEERLRAASKNSQPAVF